MNKKKALAQQMLELLKGTVKEITCDTFKHTTVIFKPLSDQEWMRNPWFSNGNLIIFYFSFFIKKTVRTQHFEKL